MTQAPFSSSPPPQRAAQEIAPGLVVQHLRTPLRLGDYRLIAFDMDSTLINIECIDEVADAAGRKAEVAAITEAAMRGEITDFKDFQKHKFEKAEWKTMAKFDRFLKEFYIITSFVEGSIYPRLSSAVPLYNSLLVFLENWASENKNIYIIITSNMR